ncbi:MAG: hypothetical protein KDB60_12995, partial [Propionibacteriaceae bacterium]|nr:hypothetical protein [Propionibacteriaceae bacterium]
PAGSAAALLPGGGTGAVLAREPSTPASSSSATTAPANASGSPAAPAVSAAPADGTPGAGAAIDYDKVVDHLESWLLRELERRGGRFGGVF